MNSLRQIRTIIYRLKRQYGASVVLVKSSPSEYNLETGAITPDETKHTIKRAIVLPVKSMAKFSYDLAYVAVNKNFTYGALYELSARFCLVDRKEYPNIELITLNDYLEFRNKRWNIKSIEIPEHDQHALMLIQTVDGNEVSS